MTTTPAARRSLAVAAGAVAIATGVAACGKDSNSGLGASSSVQPAVQQQQPASSDAPARVATTRVEVVRQLARGSFDPSVIYAHEAPGVVTVISLFDDGRGGQQLQSGSEGLGSGFAIDGDGHIATNAHVVTDDSSGGTVKRAQTVYVQFADGNQVPAEILGTDLNSDVALIKVDPQGLTLRPLPFGSSRGLTVGSPVAAIGSPFGEPQSLSVGVISGLNRTIDSLNSGGTSSDGSFAIGGAIQTDAAINHGNSGGPLVDSAGDVIGINAQIQTTGGGGEGVGFAVPIDTIRRSLAQLQASGRVDYGWVGVSTVPVFPQLAEHFGLPSETGALVQSVTPGSPAAQAGLITGGERDQPFQASSYTIGGDLITRVDGKPLSQQFDLSTAIADKAPGDTISLDVWRDGKERTVQLTLGTRPG
ncbi:MAG TPA: trypsin-like peptidase domain-containing protein [Conexibacter sp.]|jgi:S1-C subfamily serine protease